MSFLSSLKPKIYQKTFYIGKKKILKLTKEGIRKFLFKSVWILVMLLMAFSMLFGGLAMLIPQDNTTIILPENYIDLTQ